MKLNNEILVLTVVSALSFFVASVLPMPLGLEQLYPFLGATGILVGYGSARACHNFLKKQGTKLTIYQALVGIIITVLSVFLYLNMYNKIDTPNLFHLIVESIFFIIAFVPFGWYVKLSGLYFEK